MDGVSRQTEDGFLAQVLESATAADGVHLAFEPAEEALNEERFS